MDAQETKISARVVALLAASIFRRHLHSRGPGIWVGRYWFECSRDGYQAIHRSLRLARAGRLHRGAGPFGQGPRAWSTPD